MWCVLRVHAHHLVKGPGSVSKHVDSEIYDMVVAGNLVDRRISLWREKYLLPEW